MSINITFYFLGFDDDELKPSKVVGSACVCFRPSHYIESGGGGAEQKSMLLKDGSRQGRTQHHSLQQEVHHTEML
jgi:hypothetical protein